MIRKYRVFRLSQLSERFTDSELYNYSLQSMDFNHCACPNCGSTGSLKKHASYERYLIGDKGGSPGDSFVEVTRFMCISCNTTHAYIPVFMIPFSVYSLRFVLKVLLCYFQRKFTVINICDKFGISVSVLYKWIHIFKKCQKMWICALQELLMLPGQLNGSFYMYNTSTTKPEEFIGYVNQDGVFLENYQHLFGKSFLENILF